MAYTYGNFWNEVFNSLERDQRFQSLVDVACNRAIDEIMMESNFGNFTYQTPSEPGREEYDLPEGTMHVNHVTFNNIPMDRITFDEYLQRKAIPGITVAYSTWPYSFLVKDNRSLILSPTPRSTTQTIQAFITVKTDDLNFTDNEATDFPLARVYTKPAFHFARHYLYLNDNRDDDAAKEYRLFEHELGKIIRRLNGSRKTKVKRVV